MSGAAGFRERLEWDAEHGAIIDQTRRYMMIRPDALMGALASLPEPARRTALWSLEASVFEQGCDSARAYAAMGGGGEALLATVTATAPQLGWGVWRVESLPGRIVLTVVNSPFAAACPPDMPYPVCMPIQGMLRAVAGMVFGRIARVEEVACAALGAPDCRFVAEPAG
jgi:predicted hydrocarbon binding protein